MSGPAAPMLCPTDLEGVFTISIPHHKTAHGAEHHLPLSPLSEKLLVSELFDLKISHHELYRLHGIASVCSYTSPVAILPTVGKWLAVVNPASRTAAFPLRPTQGLLVPAGCGFGLQSLERNRVSFTRLCRRDTRVESELAADDPGFAGRWESTQSDPAYDPSGRRLPQPA